jgi:predicted acetyltransferase
MADIRIPEESDRERITELTRVAFNIDSAWVKHVAPTLRLDRFLCAYEHGRMVAMAQAHPLQQWFGGRTLPMAGISSVAALPERRDAGLGPEVVRAVLARARADGALVSMLYPSRTAVYRRLGYEYGGMRTQWRMPLADLPPERAAEAEELDDEHIDAVRACYRVVAAQQNGMVDTDENDWWRQRVLREWVPDVVRRGVVVKAAEGVVGYAAFHLEPLPGGWGFGASCTHLVASSAAGLRSLLGYFRAFRGVGETLAWHGPPNDPLALLAGGGSGTLQPLLTLRFMSRLLDVERALGARGYPPVEGSAVIRIRDELFPENDGPFLIRAGGDEVTATRADAAPGAELSVGALSSLFTGYSSPWDLARAGLIAGGEATLRFLADLFRGPTPWAADHF